MKGGTEIMLACYGRASYCSHLPRRSTRQLGSKKRRAMCSIAINIAPGSLDFPEADLFSFFFTILISYLALFQKAHPSFG